MKRIAQGGLLVALLASLVVACQPVDREEADVGPAIEELRDRFVEAYNRHDAPGVAELYTNNAVFVNPQGLEITGRDQIQRELETFFLEARPQLNAFPIATEGEEGLAWEMGSYQLQLELPAQPLPEPAPLGAEPIGEPAAAAQPGPPGATAQPGQPPVGPPQDRSEEGHYLIVLEREDDRWLIRAHISHAGGPAGAMPQQQPVTTPGQETPPQPPPATGPAAGEPARTRPEAVPPPATPEPDEETDLDEDDLEPPPDDADGSPGR